MKARQVVNQVTQLANMIRARRRARDIPQTELCATLGISQSAMSMIEADCAGLSIERLLLLGKLLGFQVVIQDKPRRKTAR